MTSKKYLSNKKTTQQTVSISPALKDWIQRYVKVQHDKNPNEEKFNSVSAFYTEIMEKIMGMFEKGKTLDDLDSSVDKELDNFFGKFTFQANIPFYESAVETNRYTDFHFMKTPGFLLAYRKMSMETMNPPTNETIKIWFSRIKNWFLTNKITKFVNLDLFSEDDMKYHKGVYEFIGIYKNLHYENCKWKAAIFGILGIKILDVIYSEEELYCRFNVMATDLFYTQDLLKKERLKLVKENLECLMDYNRIIDDKSYYLWMKMAENKDLIVSFKNNKARSEWIKTFESYLKPHNNPREFTLKMLKVFEKLHWISIENPVHLSFRLNITKENNSEEIEFLIDYFSKQSKLSVEDGIYYLT